MILETRNRDEIYKLCADPSIWRFVHDDHVANPTDWAPSWSESLRFLIAEDEQGHFGFGAFIARTWTCWEGHFGFLPRAYGKQAVESFREMLAWMWQHTPAERIVGEIAKDNRRAIAFAKRAGCVEYGTNSRSYRRNGKLHDQVCLGISKPE